MSAGHHPAPLGWPVVAERLRLHVSPANWNGSVGPMIFTWADPCANVEGDEDGGSPKPLGLRRPSANAEGSVGRVQAGAHNSS